MWIFEAGAPGTQDDAASPVSLGDYRVWIFEAGALGTQDDAASPVSLGDYRVWRQFDPRDSGTGSY
ncbi:MAG: hypothetical protein OXI50_15805 [Gammaproteobacteria bacterium]|nr:hypothetical protein [Gammaproteobacteria bacterium]